jgi:hypothetical protein
VTGISDQTELNPQLFVVGIYASNAEKKPQQRQLVVFFRRQKSKLEIPGYSECQCYSYAGRFLRHSDQHRFASAKG